MKKTWTAPSFQDFNVVDRIKMKKNTKIFSELLGTSEPKSVDELAVNRRKIGEVRDWIKSCCNKRSPVLLITGPPGSGKTLTLKLVADVEGYQIVEWINPMSKNTAHNFLDDFNNGAGFCDTSEIKKFYDFVTRSSRYPSLFKPTTCSLILVKDIPNTFIWRPDLFHIFLEKYKIGRRSPIVFIITDDESMDLHSNMFPNVIKAKFGIDCIKFNPVSDTFLKKNLKNLLIRFRSSNSSLAAEYLECISKNSLGDLRSATTDIILQLQTGFSSVPTKKRKLETNNDSDANQMDGLPSRDRGYDFYKKMGRILYPKREPSDLGTSTTTKLVHNVFDIAENWCKSYQGFLHENYLQTCSKLPDAVALADYFSFCDILARNRETEDYSSNVIVTGLMVSNTEPKRNGFLPFKKSFNLDHLKETKCVFNESSMLQFGTRERTFSQDVAPLLQWFSYSLDQPTRTLNSGESKTFPGHSISGKTTTSNVHSITNEYGKYSISSDEEEVNDIEE